MLNTIGASQNSEKEATGNNIIYDIVYSQDTKNINSANDHVEPVPPTLPKTLNNNSNNQALGLIEQANVILPLLAVDVQLHIEKLLKMLDSSTHTAVLKQYVYIFKTYKAYDANLFITRLIAHFAVVRNIPVASFSKFLVEFGRRSRADKAGYQAKKLIKKISGIRGFNVLSQDADERAISAQQKAEHCVNRIKNESLGLDSAIEYAQKHGIESVSGLADAQAKRLSSAVWWSGQLKNISVRGREHLEQILGNVGEKTNKYVSKSGHKYQQMKHEQTIKTLSESYAINDKTGDKVCLLDVAMGALRGRFAQLLNWVDGMSDYAEKHGLKCAMYTITCPSKMHSGSYKYDGTSVRNSQKHLSTLWNRALAQLKKISVYPFGVRVVEPHQDGTPHWHVLVFASQDDLDAIDAVLRVHALAVDGDEAGALEHRYEYKMIDKKEGGAKPSSYLFKYILKGLGGDIDVFNKDYDVADIINSEITAVKAWGKTHGIRQIQYVGGASVGVWNALRKMDAELEDGHLEEMRQACISGDFCTYFELQGGHTIGKRKHYTQVLSSSVKINREYVDVRTGEIIEDVIEQRNAYGELIIASIGIQTEYKKYLIKKDMWTIEFAERTLH